MVDRTSCSCNASAHQWSSNFLLTAAVRALQTVATYCPMSGLPVRAGLGVTPPTAPLRSPVSPAPCCRFPSWHQPEFSFCGVQHRDREGQSCVCVCTPACVLYFNSFGRTTTFHQRRLLYSIYKQSCNLRDANIARLLLI